MGEKTARAVLPMAVFAVVYQVLASLLQLGVQRYAQGGGAQRLAWFSVYAADVSAMTAAVSMTAAFALVLRMTRGEVRFSGKLTGRTDRILAAAGGILALSVFLNIFLTRSGAVAADSSAAAAGARTRQVSLPLGILVYGVLGPLAEEVIFRGVTFQRIFLVCREKFESDIDMSLSNSSIGADAFGKTAFADFASARYPYEEKKAFLLAAGLSSVLFGLYHGNAVQGLYAALMGFAFCLFLALGRNLAAVIVLHGAVNVMTLVLARTGVYETGNGAAWMAATLGIAVCCGGYVLMGKKMR